MVMTWPVASRRRGATRSRLGRQRRDHGTLRRAGARARGAARMSLSLSGAGEARSRRRTPRRRRPAAGRARARLSRRQPPAALGRVAQRVAAAYPERVRLLPIASAYATGVALNAVAPARGGDAAKVALGARRVPGRACPRSPRRSPCSSSSTWSSRRRCCCSSPPPGSCRCSCRPRARPPRTGRVAAAAVALASPASSRDAARSAAAALWARCARAARSCARPARYLRRVALVQAGAWCCRIAVVLCLLAGFGLPASIPVAGVVMVCAGRRR